MNYKTKYLKEMKRSYKAFRRFVFLVIAAIITLIIIGLSRCTSTIPVSREGEIIITKKYAGRMLTSYYHDPYTWIITDEDAFLIQERITIPNGTILYVRIDPCLMDVTPDLAERLTRRWLLYDGEKYKIISP